MQSDSSTSASDDLSTVSLQRSYRSSDDPLNSFYIPCLRRSTSYDRAAGFFDSRSLALGADGIAGLIANGGKMRLLTSPRFSDEDLETISDVIENKANPATAIDNSDINSMVDSALESGLEMETFATHLEDDRFRCLAWMLREGRLEIRVAFMPEDPELNPYRMYHEKIGLISDNNGNEVAFTGSINETAAGWTENYESFDVYRSWCGEYERIKDKRADFEQLWKNNDPQVTVRELPDSVESLIVEQSPDTIDGKPALDIFFTDEGVKTKSESGSDLELWEHQKNAIDWWKNHSYRGIFALATGTGKTFTALRAARLETDTRLTVVVVPTQILIEQWKDEIQDVFGEDIHLLECTGGTDWRSQILSLVDVYREGNLESINQLSRTVLLTTPHTASSDPFQQSLNHIDPNRLQIIVDEVHNCGAPTFQRIFDINAGRRIGLSATPDRKWDEEGTNAIYEYFGGQDPFRFETAEAIENGYLSPYEYHPLFCELKPEEYEDYQNLTAEIQRLSAIISNSMSVDDNIFQKRERLLLERARIKKSAQQKPGRFGQFLETDHPTPAIVFCEDTQQLEKMQHELEERGLSYGVYISSRKDEQGAAFHKFRTGAIEYLLAIRCLDEGVDVPDCPTAILISSSTNERQFIQRRGRVLRTSAGKDKAVIYDMLVFPGVQAAADDEAAVSLIKQEIKRAKVLMNASMNRDMTQQKLAKELGSYNKDISYLAYL